MDLTQPLTYEEQLNRLLAHGLIIDEKKKEYYQEILSKVNYYRFTGYALQFRVGENDSDFVEGSNIDNFVLLGMWENGFKYDRNEYGFRHQKTGKFNRKRRGKR